MPGKESQLISEAIQYLLACGIPAWRNHSVRFFGQAKGGKRYAFSTGTKGASDIIGCLPPRGTLLAMEAKTGKGKTTVDQEKFMAAIRKAGGATTVFRSLSELERWLEEVIRKAR